jgi:hypothetical protein
MAGQVEKRELLIPIRTILVVSAAIGILGAFVAIGDTFLIVFVEIFVCVRVRARLFQFIVIVITNYICSVGTFRFVFGGFRDIFFVGDF